MEARYWYRNNRKSRYISHTSQDVTLKSGFTVLQTKKALSKAWIGYTIAKITKGTNRCALAAEGYDRRCLDTKFGNTFNTNDYIDCYVRAIGTGLVIISTIFVIPRTIIQLLGTSLKAA